MAVKYARAGGGRSNRLQTLMQHGTIYLWRQEIVTAGLLKDMFLLLKQSKRTELLTWAKLLGTKGKRLASYLVALLKKDTILGIRGYLLVIHPIRDCISGFIKSWVRQQNAQIVRLQKLKDMNGRIYLGSIKEIYQIGWNFAEAVIGFTIKNRRAYS